jgi:hypothetical protein
VDFSIRVGVHVPESVHLYSLPAEVIEIVPKYSGYSYFVVNDQIVIVQPETHEIVETIAYSGTKGRAQRTNSRSSRLSSHHHKVVRSKTRTTEHTIVKRRYIIGERIPDDADYYDFPDAVYSEVPAVRSYRYMPREREGVVVVEPGDRRVIELIE